MNIFTTQNRLRGQALAVFTAVSMMLSFLPFSAQVAEAATSVSFSLFVVPNPVGTDSDLEYVTISNTSGQDVDMAGWKLVEGGDEIALSGVMSGPSDSLACSNTSFAQNGGKNCDYGFPGGFALVNTGGSVSLVAPGGETVVTVSWGDVSGSESDAAVSDSGSLDGVLGTTGGDSIYICHATESESNPYNAISPNLNSFFNGHDTDTEDIIPPFYYDNGNGMQYFAGNNWDTEGQELWDNDCGEDQVVLGCTDIEATNYDPEATEDDGSCEFPQEETAKIIAHKLVCTDEADIPNESDWASLEPIDADTAEDWLLTHDSCSLVPDWSFEWIKNSQKTDPGDTLVGPAGGAWSIFGVTDANGMTMVELSSEDLGDDKRIWFREVLKEGYLAFTHGQNENQNVDDYSAAFFCNNDVVNYDNLEWINNVKVGNTYHCVAWNHQIRVDGCTDQEALNYNENATHDDDSCEYPEERECRIGENLLKNASFEEPAIRGDWALTSIVDWVVTKVSDNSAIDGELWRGLFGGPSHGEQNVELDSTAPTQLTQNVTTIPGATYELRFDFSPRKATGLADNNVDALVDGGVLMNAQGDGSNLTENTWTTHSDTFVAAGASTEVMFRDNGTANGKGSLIDNAALCLIKEPQQCEDENPGWADAVEDFDQGNKKGGAAVNANRSDATAALGESDWSDGDSDGFVSLGFGGTITVEFDKFVPDTDGGDISIHEATNGANYPEESALIEVSQNGSDWKTVGTASNMDDVSTRVSYFDISSTGWSWIKFVRVTDTTDSTPHNNDADGFDLDAVDATKELCDEPKEPKFGKIKVFKWVKNQHPENVPFEDFSFQIDSDDPIHFNKWGFAWDMKPLGNTYEVNETNIPTGYNHFMTVCKVFNHDDYKYEHDGDQLEQLPYEMEQYKAEHDFIFSPSNEVTLEDEGDFGVCLIINKKDGGGGEPLECKPGVELIANGGFEEPVVDNDAGWNIFDNGISWLVEWLSPNGDATDPASLELHGGVNGWLPSEGNQYAELDGDYEGPGGDSGEPASTEISQTIDTIPGETYTLKWDFSPRPGTVESENDLLVKVDGLEVENNEGVGGNQTNWTSHSYSFVATDDETEIAFADDGPANSVGTFVDNVSLMCEPETPYGPYCGDGVKNQEWEQCDLGYVGDQTGDTDYGVCNSKCQYENQCSIEQLVRINLDDTDSPSIDGKLYLGNKSNPIPAGTWFKFDVAGDDSVYDIAEEVDGLAVERDQTNGLQLAFRGGNERQALDIVAGSIELKNLKNGVVTRYLIDSLGDYDLEDGSGNSFADIFDKVGMYDVNFDMRADTGNDGVTLGLNVDEEAIAQCNPDDNEYTLTVTITGDGSGIVESTDTNISCDSSGSSTQCVQVYNAGTVVDLTATADPGSNFDNSWTTGFDTCTGNTSPCQVTMNSNVDLVAHFDLDGITTNGGGGGGGGGRKIELGGGGSGTTGDPDPGPTPQVAGEQVSVVPFGAPNAGAGGAAPVSPWSIPTAWLGLVVIAQRKHYVR